MSTMNRPRKALPLLAGTVVVSSLLACGSGADASAPQPNASAVSPTTATQPASTTQSAATTSAGATKGGPLPQPTRAHLASSSTMQPIAKVGSSVGRSVDRKGNRLSPTESLCQQPTPLGQRTTLVRDFPKITTTQVVLGFDSVARASAARATILGWYSHCTIDTDTNSTTGDVWAPLALTGVRSSKQVPARATATEASRHEVGVEDGDFEEASVVQVGNRLSWVLVRSTGQDSNCSVLPDDPEIGQCGAFAVARPVAQQLLRR